MVKTILRMEGLAVLLASTWLYYFRIDETWWLFPLLLLVPNAFMLGYAKSKRIGAIIYNLGHTYIPALAVIIGGTLMDSTLIASLGVIIAAHNRADRASLHGLKYSTHFKDTHLNRL